MHIIILQGLPGSGKSTWAESKYPNADDTLICSADTFFQKDGKYQFDASKLGEAHEACLREFTSYVSQPDYCASGLKTVIVDNTNLTWLEMAPYVAFGFAFGHTVEIVRFDVDKFTCAGRNIHNVPFNSLMTMAIRLSKNLDAGMPPHWIGRVKESVAAYR